MSKREIENFGMVLISIYQNKNFIIKLVIGRDIFY